MDSTVEDGSNDASPVGDDTKTLINIVLGEMKAQFNMTERKVNNVSQSGPNEEVLNDNDNSPCNSKSDILEPVNGEDKVIAPLEENIEISTSLESVKTEKIENDQESQNEQNDDKPRLVFHFKKPNTESSTKSKTKTEDSPNSKRSLRHKTGSPDDKIEESALKRSSRRRSKDCNESVLQSAIARKEKSYNESNKPQRLTRQLKPTPKVLENLALAKQEKTKTDKSKYQKVSDKHKIYDTSNDFENGETKLTKKHKSDRTRRIPKRSKTADYSKDSDSEFDSSASPNSAKQADQLRRSQRVLSREDSNANIDEPSALEPNTAEQSSLLPSDPESTSVTAQLIASRLCHCTRKSQFYPYSNGEIIHCGAIDSVNEKLVGCMRVVDKDNSLMRPSSRIPYTPFCEVHKNRMLRHNCCPTCGIFCTQGRFTQCESKHQYHRNCQISVGDVQCCPHCGSSTPDYDIYVTMHSSKKPIFLPTQKPPSTTNITTG